MKKHPEGENGGAEHITEPIMFCCLSIQLKRQINKIPEQMFFIVFFYLALFDYISKIYFRFGLLFSINIIHKLNFQDKNHTQNHHSSEGWGDGSAVKNI